MSEPRLPVELERKIFELAAHSHSKSIPILFLVAHRVKLWLEPILYSVVVFSDPLPGHVCFEPTHFTSAIQSQAISEHVTNLFIPFDSKQAPDLDLDLILASCSAVQNLVLFPKQTDLLPFLSSMPLRRLTIPLDDVFSPANIDFLHPLFSHITHLELMDGPLDNSRWEEYSGLALLPNLTHLSFLVQRSLRIFQGALAACPALQVLVALYWKFHVFDPAMGLESLGQDTRFVCMPAPSFAQDWQIGARGGEDFWVRAEKFIAQRVSGQIDRGTFVLREG
ncbi:hypothetical protein MVEN_01803800 [Mycena venus]|uniref:Uncharacterized protein n=1 Tax=Mycena venus TaxID=2733690 RepID=A0A8H7CLK6_9AGAR|nr:hypothetical protein MVEN_01803800 [Mycena venus]